MLMQKITSSNITAAGYDNGTMRVQFSNGTQYDYKGVSPQMFDGFVTATSQGRFFHKLIKPKFTGTKVIKETGDGKGTLR